MQAGGLTPQTLKQPTGTTLLTAMGCVNVPFLGLELGFVCVHDIKHQWH